MSEDQTNSGEEETAQTEAAPAETAAATGTEERPHLRKTRVGLVVSDKMNKTIVVDVVRRVPHPHFKKIIKRTSSFYVHDEKGEAVVGDKVMIQETRPISKKKRWKLIEVLAH